MTEEPERDESGREDGTPEGEAPEGERRARRVHWSTEPAATTGYVPLRPEEAYTPYLIRNGFFALDFMEYTAPRPKRLRTSIQSVAARLDLPSNIRAETSYQDDQEGRPITFVNFFVEYTEQGVLACSFRPHVLEPYSQGQDPNRKGEPFDSYKRMGLDYYFENRKYHEGVVEAGGSPELPVVHFVENSANVILFAAREAGRGIEVPNVKTHFQGAILRGRSCIPVAALALPNDAVDASRLYLAILRQIAREE